MCGDIDSNFRIVGNEYKICLTMEVLLERTELKTFAKRHDTLKLYTKQPFFATSKVFDTMRYFVRKFAALKIHKMVNFCVLPVHPLNGCPVYPSLQVQTYPAPF